MHPYHQARKLAHEVRERYEIEGAKVGLSLLRRVYKAEGVGIVYWDYKFRSIKGAYINDEYGPTVMVAKSLPNDPKVFTLAHELKHHLIDQGACSTIGQGMSSIEREIAAEVFAAELLFPQHIFITELEARGVARDRAFDIDRLKRAVIDIKRDTGTSLSYAGLVKMTKRLGFDPGDELNRVQWKKFEESIYGKPFRRTKAYSAAA